jgi:mannose-6-phosphate isomerase-like protein (cupin superfamily)/ribosomal protein S18 acetylase RimI-like enzyme
MTPAPLLRPARPEDAAAITALTREAYAKWVDVIGREPLPMQVDYAEALQRHRFDLLFIGDALAGLIETVADGEFLLIENLAIRPHCQKRGYGGDLLRWAESIADQAGLRGLRLCTNRRFAENIRFYERFGFLIEREAPHGGGVIVYMRKMLTQAPPSDTRQISSQVNLAEKLASFSELWSPRTVAQFNGFDVMVVKVQDEFVWHKHDDTDDFFLVLKGRLEIELRDRTIALAPGELFIVPKGVEHRPHASEETHLLLIEPTGTPNTGDATTAAPRVEI